MFVRCCLVLLGIIFSFITIATLIGVTATQASPTLILKQRILTLPSSQFDAFTPFTRFACAAYFKPSKILAWSCGSICDSSPGFEPVASGGDGGKVQYWYVGYDPNNDTIIVGHQGTDPNRILALLTNIEPLLTNLDPTLFPGLPSGIEVHDGFRAAHSDTAMDILVAVQSALLKYKTTSVTLVGHSLGAALSLLDSVYLQLHLPPGTTIKTILYALPRVGNQVFADYVDANLNITRINHRDDPIPILPGRFLGYVHVSGELHIRDSGDVAVCPGQDNPSPQCSAGIVTNIFDSVLTDHSGPYNGIKMTTCRLG